MTAIRQEYPAVPILGAHMSISGGYFRAVEIARDCGCDCAHSGERHPRIGGPARQCRSDRGRRDDLWHDRNDRHRRAAQKRVGGPAARL